MLERWTEFSRKNEARGIEPPRMRESSSGLSAAKGLSWASLLTSLATSEKIENLILEPLQKRFAGDAEIAHCLRQHGQDEVRHYEWLTAYVQANSSYRRRGKSLSDRLLYDFALPRMARLAETRPIYLFALMYFYEAFTLDFYRELRREAARDGRLQLIQLIQLIEKDERRHLSLVKLLIGHSENAEGRLSRSEKFKLRLLLKIFQLDMSTEWWCVHNRRVRASTQALGIPPAGMRRMSQSALDQVFEVLK